MQVVLVYLQPFRRNSLLKCVLQPKIAKNSIKPLFGDWRSFKVVDVDKSKQPVTSACYDRQQVCTYLQPFSHYKSQQRQNNVSLEGVPLFDALVRGESPSPTGTKFCSGKLESLGQHAVKVLRFYFA